MAEGVETAAASSWLTAAGCDVAQGYHVARPMVFEQLVDWLADATCPEGGRAVGRDVGAAACPGVAVTPPR